MVAVVRAARRLHLTQSQAQIDAFLAVIGPNSRPIEALNRRVVTRNAAMTPH